MNLPAERTRPTSASGRQLRGAPLLCLVLLSVSMSWPNSVPAAGDSIAFPVHVAAGWNLLSVPVRVSDGAPTSIFPTSGSGAVVFDSGYHSLDTLIPGQGFWMKFDTATTVTVTGEGTFLDSISIHEGWNLVGTLTTPVIVRRIETEPPGIISSYYYRYVPGVGYAAADTIWPGSGYWVKANAPGRIKMISGGFPCPGVPSISYGGRTYHTVQIGDQCWLRENLDIGERVDGGVIQTDNGIVEKYCFNDVEVNCVYYGGLYQWDEAMKYTTAGGARGLCPDGWHIPTREDFTHLISSARGDGNALKALRQGIGDGLGTNASGFSGLMAGYRQLDGNFSIAGYYTYFWLSEEGPTTGSTSLFFFAQYPDVYFIENLKDYGFCVRCVMD